LIYQRRAACGNAIAALDRSAARRVVVLAKACHERAGALLRNTAACRRNHMAETQDEW
jgi:hypothetical protein